MTDDHGLEHYLRACRAEIEHALTSVLPAPPACPTVLANAMRYSLTAGGKRLRPILCLASAESVGAAGGLAVNEAWALAMPCACALEMIHTYSLIHDDLPAMDNDTLRRGRPTLHVVAGEGIAILAGDGLLTEALALMAKAPLSTEPAIAGRKLHALDVVSTAAGVTGMVGGQALDLEATPSDGVANMDAEALRTMHRKKTGALITAAAVSGAIMAGGDASAIATMSDCGARFGLAFQIMDDILDVEGASAVLGKTPGKDAAAGKPTYPALFGLAESRRMAHEQIEQAAATLAAAGFGQSRLLGIGRWIVDRSN